MRTDITAINARTISINGVPIAGSAAASGPYTTFDQLDADAVLYLNGTLIQGTLPPAAQVSNYGDINVLSGVSLGDTIKYGVVSTPATNAATGPLNGGSGSSTPTPTPAFTGFALNGSTNPALKTMLSRVAAGTGRGKIVVMGDSTDVGVGAGTGSSFTIGARPYRMPATLAASLSSAGVAALDRGFAGDAGMSATSSGTLTTYDPRVTYSTSVTANGGENFPGGAYLNGDNGGGNLSFVETGDTFVITYIASNSGTIAVTIDGAAPTSGPASITPGAAGGFVRYVVRAASAGQHTLTLTNGAAAPALVGVRAYTSTTSALDMIVLAAAGATTANQAAIEPTSHWYNRDALAFEAPDLTIIGPYFNDPNNSVPLQTTINNLQAIVTTAKVSGDVLLLSKYPAGGNYGANQSAANSAIKTLASSNGVACMSLFEYFGSAFTPALAARMADGIVHAKAELYAEEGDVLRRCIQAMAQ